MRLAAASKDARLALRSIQCLLQWLDGQHPHPPPNQRKGNKVAAAMAAAAGGAGEPYSCPAVVLCCLHQLVSQVCVVVGG